MAKTDRKATEGTGEGRVVIRDIALPKSVTLPPWFTDLAGLEERARRAKAAREDHTNSNPHSNTQPGGNADPGAVPDLKPGP